MITDAWEGIDLFFEPGKEILVAESGYEVADYLKRLPAGRARALGEAAYRRVLAEHTYAHRAVLFEQTITGGNLTRRASF